MGSMMTISTTGKMNNAKGIVIFTGNLLACSSARSKRLSRISSLKTRSASAMSLPLLQIGHAPTIWTVYA